MSDRRTSWLEATRCASAVSSVSPATWTAFFIGQHIGHGEIFVRFLQEQAAWRFPLRRGSLRVCLLTIPVGHGDDGALDDGVDLKDGCGGGAAEAKELGDKP